MSKEIIINQHVTTNTSEKWWSPLMCFSEYFL